MIKILSLFLFLILSGCGSSATIPIISDKPVYIDPRALESCKDLVVPETVTFESILNSSILNAEIYLDCRNKQEISIKLLKEFSNHSKGGT